MYQNNLKGKNFALIFPKFFNYECDIKDELERQGAFVYLVDDRVKDSFLTKILFRLKLSEKISRNSVIRYFEHHLDNIKTRKIDFVMAITPEGFSKEIAERYKKQL